MPRAGDIHQHTISAVALEDTSLIILSRHALYQLHQEEVGPFALLLMSIARELARTLQFMDELLLKSIHTQEEAKVSGA